MQPIVLPKLGEFLSNIQNPNDPKTRQLFTGYSYHEWIAGDEAIECAWQRHLEWVRENVIGPPQATDCYTTEQLIAMGMVAISGVQITTLL